ncbi:phytanoyl-CoA dioxygenase [Aureococcus anophagefferens]|nr:phytanoyl-CoA dioxygenase [Aureococcus anophagefferens]
MAPREASPVPLAQWGSMLTAATCAMADEPMAAPHAAHRVTPEKAAALHAAHRVTPDAALRELARVEAAADVATPVEAELAAVGDAEVLAEMSRSSQWQASLKGWLTHHEVCSSASASRTAALLWRGGFDSFWALMQADEDAFKARGLEDRRASRLAAALRRDRAAVIARRDDADRALELVQKAAKAGREVHVAVYDGDESLAARVSAAGLAAVIADEPKDFLLFPSTFAPLPAAEETRSRGALASAAGAPLARAGRAPLFPRVTPPNEVALEPVQGASPLFPRVTPPNEVALEPVRALFRPPGGATFLEHGVAVIPNAVDDATVDACRTRAIEDLAACEAAVAQRLEALDPTAPDAHHEAVRCERCDFAELVRRDGGRCDVRVRCGDAPYADLFRHEAILPAALAALGGGDVVLLYSGVMVARAGAAEDQKWHKDGDHLFAEGGDQPPHALTVFIPLQDLTPSNGPTEFRLGSHRRSAESPPKRSRRSPVPLFPATFAPWAPRALAADAADDTVLFNPTSM